MRPRTLLLCSAVLFVISSSNAFAASRKAKLVGVVFARDARPGERASGSIVLYPAAIQGLSGLEVQNAGLQYDDSKPRKAALKGYVVDTGSAKTPANQSFAVDIPAGASSVQVTIDKDDQPVATVVLPVGSSTAAPLTCGSSDWVNGTEADGTQSNYRMPATICYAGLATIAGDFYGDAALTRVEVGGEHARIIAESRRYCYFLVPRDIAPGPSQVSLHEGSHSVSFREMIPRLDLLQALEDNGSGVAESPPSDTGASDAGAASLPFGIGVGGVDIGGGGGDEGDGDIEYGEKRRTR
jgi:hypothetical protein